MVTVILTIHTLIVLGLIAIVLLQRSEGGALGIGGGGGGGFMTSRGAANALTRTTSVLAAMFFATSISLAIFADRGESDLDIIEDITGEELGDPNAPITTDDLSDFLGADEDDGEGATAPGEPLAAPDLSDALGGDDAEPETPPADAAPESEDPADDPE